MRAVAATMILLLALPLAAQEEPAKPVVTLSGLAQVHVRGFFDQSGPVAETPDTFLLRRAELRVTAVVTPRISGTVMVDVAKQLSIGSSGANPSSNILQEVVLTYQLSPKTHIDVGQFKIPIGYEGDLVSSAALPNVERALFFQARDPRGGGHGDVRDTGVRVRAAPGPFELQLGIFNGLGERQNTTAVADEKAVAARVLYHVPAIRGLRVGISGGYAGAGAQPSRTVGNAFAVYKQGKLTLQSEYVGAKHQFEPRGGYAHVGWAFTPKIEATARYDVFDFDRNSAGGTTVRDAILGINYSLRGNHARVQANLIHRHGGESLSGTPGLASSAAAFANS
ncbi:MAG TPA: porin, partial [Thermoanaerobaculia bacterium]|nr:porin [Thermoanaerobaculia bacterium]